MGLQPLERNKYGLGDLEGAYAFPPVGYQLADHRRPIPTSQREKALEYLRKRQGSPKCGFSEITSEFRTPAVLRIFPFPYSCCSKRTTRSRWRDGAGIGTLAGIETRTWWSFLQRSGGVMVCVMPIMRFSRKELLP